MEYSTHSLIPIAGMQHSASIAFWVVNIWFFRKLAIRRLQWYIFKAIFNEILEFLVNEIENNNDTPCGNEYFGHSVETAPLDITSFNTP